MTRKALKKQQLKTLRSMAHALKPVVRLGQNGLTDAVLQELEIALDHHELVKVKLAGSDREDRSNQLETLSNRSRATVVQSIGHTATLFRRNELKPVIEL